MELVQPLNCLHPDPENEWWSPRDMNSLSALKPTGTVLSVLLLPFTLLRELHEHDSATAVGPESHLVILNVLFHWKVQLLIPLPTMKAFFLSLPCSKAFSRVGDVVPLKNAYGQKVPMFDLQHCLKTGMVNDVCNPSL